MEQICGQRGVAALVVRTRTQGQELSSQGGGSIGLHLSAWEKRLHTERTNKRQTVDRTAGQEARYPWVGGSHLYLSCPSVRDTYSNTYKQPRREKKKEEKKKLHAPFHSSIAVYLGMSAIQGSSVVRNVHGGQRPLVRMRVRVWVLLLVGGGRRRVVPR